MPNEGCAGKRGTKSISLLTMTIGFPGLGGSVSPVFFEEHPTMGFWVDRPKAVFERIRRSGLKKSRDIMPWGPQHTKTGDITDAEGTLLWGRVNYSEEKSGC